MAVQDLQGLAGKHRLVLLGQRRGIPLFIFLHLLQAVFVLLSVSGKQGDDRVHFPIECFTLQLFAELRDERNVVRLHLSPPRLKQRQMQLRQAS